jgi:hypothetical protein
VRRIVAAAVTVVSLLMAGCGSATPTVVADTSAAAVAAAAAPSATAEPARLTVKQAAAVFGTAVAPVDKATTVMNAALARPNPDMPTVRTAGQQLATAYRTFLDVLNTTKWPAAVQPDVRQLAYYVAKMVSWASTLTVMLGPPLPPQPTDDGFGQTVRTKLGLPAG